MTAHPLVGYTMGEVQATGLACCYHFLRLLLQLQLQPQFRQGAHNERRAAIWRARTL
jgi:hypothetical protein